MNATDFPSALFFLPMVWNHAEDANMVDSWLLNALMGELAKHAEGDQIITRAMRSAAKQIGAFEDAGGDAMSVESRRLFDAALLHVETLAKGYVVPAGGLEAVLEAHFEEVA